MKTLFSFGFAKHRKLKQQVVSPTFIIFFSPKERESFRAFFLFFDNTGFFFLFVIKLSDLFNERRLKVKEFFERAWTYLKQNKDGFKVFGYAVLNAVLIYYCLELGNKNPFFNGVFYTGINVLIVFSLVSAIFFFVQRWWISSLVVTVPVLCLSIANYYTILYRNSPISTQDIHNFGTTLSVIDSYSFPFSLYVLGILICLVLIILVTHRLYRLEKGKKVSLRAVVGKNLAIVVFFTAFFYTVFLAENPIKPRNTFVWSWEDSYYKYGYAASSIEVFQNSMNMVNKPENYSYEKLVEIAEKEKNQPSNQETPDIIFILNETFYDMRDLIDLEGEPSAMPFIDSLPDSQRGRVVVAGTGGGTNKSEYELLTSNTIQLMPGITPFNYLDFDNSNSIVSYLEGLGYTSWGAHCADSLNYSRGNVYPKLGFDKILFSEDFGEYGKYGERPYATDEYCYQKMLEDYEKMGNAPRFMYLLTIQNHGGWDINPQEKNLVSLTKDFGEHTDDLEEFQSCIKLSDTAFEQLTKYFENVDRKVIICMVGDHAPSFATELVDNVDLEKTFTLRSTPCVLWANYEAEIEVPKLTSMPYMAPMTLRAANCLASPFYDYLAEMQRDVPVLTAFGLCVNAEGEHFGYDEDGPYKAQLDTYLDMVYNNASSDAERVQALFEARK